MAQPSSREPIRTPEERRVMAQETERAQGRVRAYVDHNATSRMGPEVRELLLAGPDEGWGNPSSVHAAGRRARTRDPLRAGRA